MTRPSLPAPTGCMIETLFETRKAVADRARDFLQ